MYEAHIHACAHTLRKLTNYICAIKHWGRGTSGKIMSPKTAQGSDHEKKVGKYCFKYR